MKQFFLTLTAVSAILFTTDVTAQTGNPSGGSTQGSATGGTTQTRDTKAGNPTKSGNPGTSTGSGSAGSTKDAGVGKSGGSGKADKTESTKTKGSTADTKSTKAIPSADVKCCADVLYRDANKGMIPVVDNPFKGKFEGRKLNFELKDEAGKLVPTSKYSLTRDNDGNIVIVPNGLTGKGYSLVLTVAGTKDSETYHISLM